MVNYSKFGLKNVRFCTNGMCLWRFSGGGFAILLPEPVLPNGTDDMKTETLLTLACALADVLSFLHLQISIFNHKNKNTR